jgi:hypothetical protein
MISNAVPGPNDVCEVDGEQLNEVMIVGRVIEMRDESMRTIIGVSDSTGYLEVTFFHKGD